MKTTNNTHTHKTLLPVESVTMGYWHADHSVPPHLSSFRNHYGGHTAFHLEINRWEQEEDE